MTKKQPTTWQVSDEARAQVAAAQELVVELEQFGDVGEVSYLMVLDALACMGYRLEQMAPDPKHVLNGNVASEAYMAVCAGLA